MLRAHPVGLMRFAQSTRCDPRALSLVVHFDLRLLPVRPRGARASFGGWWRGCAWSRSTASCVDRLGRAGQLSRFPDLIQDPRRQCRFIFGQKAAVVISNHVWRVLDSVAGLFIGASGFQNVGR